MEFSKLEEGFFLTNAEIAMEPFKVAKEDIIKSQ
jgi:hypothetical protein